MDAKSVSRIEPATPALYAELPRLSWAAQLAVVWTAAGGAAAGGIVPVLLLTGRMHTGAVAGLALLLVTVGGMLGAVHGAVLGYVGRHAGKEVVIRRRDRVWSILAVLAALAAAAGLTQWLLMSSVLIRAGRGWSWLPLLAGVAVAVGIGATATVLGWRSLERAYLEWPRHGLGAMLIAGSFTVLCLTFLALQPAVPGTRVQLPFIGWVIVAALATIWVATPAVIMVLRFPSGRGRREGRLRNPGEPAA
jgi:MFS family permease